jgi:3-dehydroquinate synthase class II
MMYYVQWKIDTASWQNDKKFASLEDALNHAAAEAQRVIVTPHRVIKIKKNGKVNVLAKFKPMREA